MRFCCIQESLYSMSTVISVCAGYNFVCRVITQTARQLQNILAFQCRSKVMVVIARALVVLGI